MSLFEIFGFFKKMSDPVSWNESERDVLAVRVLLNESLLSKPSLVVRDTQLALLASGGQVVDVFEPGTHALSKPKAESEIYFYTTREQIDQRWGTATPITIADPTQGTLQVRAHGVFSYRIRNPKIFFAKVSGSKDVFRKEELQGQLRSAILTNFATFLGKSEVSFSEMAKNQVAFSEQLKVVLTDVFASYGLRLESFFVQSVSLPESSK
jgi:membrane protease subunit (stomatin/prohibitin family)